MKSPRRSAVAALFVGAIAFAAGCADETGPTAPASAVSAGSDWLIASTPLPDADPRLAQGRSPYPLQLGNLWKYRAHVRIQAEGAGETEPPEEVIRTTKTEIVGATTLLDRCYTVEESAITEDVDPGEVFTQRVYYRQDRDGLYEADTPTGSPVDGPRRAPVLDPTRRFDRYLATLDGAAHWQRAAARIGDRVRGIRAATRPAGAYDNELLRLHYPLHPRKQWVVVDDAFRMTATVEHRENLDLPVGTTPAWRLRLESDLYGPDDRVHVFYGRDGYVGWRVLVYEDVVDEQGQVIGRLRFTDEEYLQEVSIDRRSELACPGPLRLKDGPDLEAR